MHIKKQDNKNAFKRHKETTKPKHFSEDPLSSSAGTVCDLPVCSVFVPDNSFDGFTRFAVETHNFSDNMANAV